MCARYPAASIKPFGSEASAVWRTTIQPSPYGSLFTISGRSSRTLFTSTTVPLSGAKISLTAFTDSTTPMGSPCFTTFPTRGSSTNTTSVSSCCAWSVMPGFDNCSFELAAPEQMVVAPDCRSIGQGPRDLRVAVVVEDQPQETRLLSVPDAHNDASIATQDTADIPERRDSISLRRQ